MTKNPDALIFATPRTDGALIAGDITSGQPDTVVPSRDPIVRPPTLGGANAPRHSPATWRVACRRTISRRR